MGVSDRELVAAAAAGDPAAFAALVERHRARVEGVVRRLLARDEAEDVTQEALLRAYLGMSTLRDPDRFLGWVCGIAVNLAKMRLRRLALQRRVAVGAANLAAEGDRELLRTVQDAVELLPAGQRDAVLMHYVDDLSCEEIARLLGTTPGAVRVRLHRARTQLRRQLAPLAPVPIEPRKEPTMIPMTLDDVLVRVAPEDPSSVVADQRIVLLREEAGERFLAIWIGASEGNAVAFPLRGSAPGRPVSSDLMVELLRATGARVERVAVTALREKTFYGSVVLGVDGRTEELDARPSDALALAVRVAAPILVADEVLDEVGATREEVEKRLDADAARAGYDLPEGSWTSLSAALLESLHRPPK
jgi:RNA polymerase sigma factor (sigma-70 family)